MFLPFTPLCCPHCMSTAFLLFSYSLLFTLTPSSLIHQFIVSLLVSTECDNITYIYSHLCVLSEMFVITRSCDSGTQLFHYWPSRFVLGVPCPTDHCKKYKIQLHVFPYMLNTSFFISSQSQHSSKVFQFRPLQYFCSLFINTLFRKLINLLLQLFSRP